MSNPEKIIDWQTVKLNVEKVRLKFSLPLELYNQLKFRSGSDSDLLSATVEEALASFLVNADESKASDEQNRQIYTYEDYDKLLEINPNDYKAWYGRGVVLKNLGSYEEAIASLDKALEIKLDYYKAWYARGNALYGLDFYEEAIVSYDKAIELKPDYAKAWYYRGKALDELGCEEKAIASYNQAFKIQSDKDKAWKNRDKALGSLGLYKDQPSVLRVLVVDDHELTRLTLKLAFSRQKNIQVVGLASNGQEAVEMVKRYHPDVIVLDLHMPVMDGWSASSHIKAIAPNTQIIAYFSVEDTKCQETREVDSLDAFCKKDTPTTELIAQVRKLGEKAVNHSHSNQNLALAEAQKYDLTPREAEIWLLRRANLSYKEIATQLYITINTVKKHLKNIYAKLDCYI